MEKSTEKTKKGFKFSKGARVCVVACLVVLIFAMAGFAYAAAYSRILPNVHIGGVNVGGMTEIGAEKEISGLILSAQKDRSIDVLCLERRSTVSFDELKLKADAKETVKAAHEFGRDGGVVKKMATMVKLWFSPEEIDVAVDFDKEMLDRIIDELAEGKEEKPTETDFYLEENQLIITKGQPGRKINREKAIKKIIDAATDENVKEITLELETVELKQPDLEEFYKRITAPKKDAQYVLENGEIRIEPEKIGVEIEKSRIKEAIESDQDRFALDVKTSMPDVTQDALEALLFRDTLGSFSSSFLTSTYERASNVLLTANRINGKILMPGDVFSYDSTIGRRTLENGYKEAGVYIGNKVESGIGGGICQTSSTLYSAVLYSNLEIVARTSHSLPVSYVPLGQDATIAEGYIDFKFKNNTEYPIKIVATVSGRQLTCSLLGVKVPNVSVELINTIVSTHEPGLERTENAQVPKGYKRILNKGAKGFTVQSKRVVKESGKVIKTENLTRSVYRAAPIEEEVNPLDKDTPSENLKIYTPGMEVLEEGPKDTEVKEPEAEEKTKTDIKTENEGVSEEEGSAEEVEKEDTNPTDKIEDEIVNV